jgi:hypothetical protein
LAEKTRSKGAGIVAVGLAGLTVSAVFQMNANKEETERKAVKITLQVTSLRDTKAAASYGIGAVPGPPKVWNLKWDKEIEFYSRRETVIVPKGTRVFLIAQPIGPGPVFCTIINGAIIVDGQGSEPTGQAICKHTPR